MNANWRVISEEVYKGRHVLKSTNHDGLLPRGLAHLMYHNVPEWFEYDPTNLIQYTDEEVKEVLQKANTLVRSYVARGFSTVNVEITPSRSGGIYLKVQKLMKGSGFKDEDWVTLEPELNLYQANVTKALKYALDLNDFDYNNNNYLKSDLTLDLYSGLAGEKYYKGFIWLVCLIPNTCVK